jgi:hypothetical protein
MKKSELIREAIDARLQVSFSETNNQHKKIRLWNCFAAGVSAEFAIELNETVLEPESESFFCDRWNSEAEFFNAQCIRFMYAEFLALMFEDEEAAEELQRQHDWDRLITGGM